MVFQWWGYITICGVVWCIYVYIRMIYIRWAESCPICNEALWGTDMRPIRPVTKLVCQCGHGVHYDCLHGPYRQNRSNLLPATNPMVTHNIKCPICRVGTSGPFPVFDSQCSKKDFLAWPRLADE
jgi:hypothetical protein